MTHYETLGIDKNATQEEIKKAYKDLVKKYHPDIYKGNKDFAVKKTQEINEAYDVLSNATLKAEYDESLNPKPVNSYTSDVNYSYNPNETKYSYTPPTYDEHNNSYTKYDDINEMYKRHYQTYSTKTRSSTIPNINNYNPEDEEIVFSKRLRQLATKIVTKRSIFITIIILFVIYFIYLLMHLSDIFSGNTSPSIMNYKTYNPDLNPNYVVESEEDDEDSDEDDSSTSNYRYIYEDTDEDLDSSDETSTTDENDSSDGYTEEDIYNILFGNEDEDQEDESSEEETEVVTPSTDSQTYDIRNHLGTTYEEADEYLQELYNKEHMDQIFESYDDFIRYLNNYYRQYGDYNYFGI